jgi:putative transposase
MARSLRLLYPGALYHVTARGNRLGAIFSDDADRRAWLGIVRKTCARFHFSVHAYCQMGNHYHLLVETPDANLPKGMAYLSGVYTQYFNRRHGLAGHVFQGRYKAVLVQKESHLVELSRYLVLNPVRAGLVKSAREWAWSSYHWTVGEDAPPPWLNTDWLLSQFGLTRREAVGRYVQFVQQASGGDHPLIDTKFQLILGDERFAAAQRARSSSRALADAAKAQRRHANLSLAEYEAAHASRDEAMARAFWSTAFSMADIARYFGVSTKTVSRAVCRYEDALAAEPSR